MTIHLKPDQEHRIAEAVRSGVYHSADEVIDRALEVLLENDHWLAANREAIDAKIRRGIEELDRGEGIPDDELDAHLERLKAQPERRTATAVGSVTDGHDGAVDSTG